MGTLKDLVPPLELCKQLPEGAFKDSALVHVSMYVLDNMLKIEDIVPRACLEHCKDSYSVMAPAPTLQEIMDELYAEDAGTHECTLEFVTCERNQSGWEVDTSYACNANCADCAECKDVTAVDTNNPAVALLKVYLKKKGIIDE